MSVRKFRAVWLVDGGRVYSGFCFWLILNVHCTDVNLGHGGFFVSISTIVAPALLQYVSKKDTRKDYKYMQSTPDKPNA